MYMFVQVLTGMDMFMLIEVRHIGMRMVMHVLVLWTHRSVRGKPCVMRGQPSLLPGMHQERGIGFGTHKQ
jgi:hypothetical protein